MSAEMKVSNSEMAGGMRMGEVRRTRRCWRWEGVVVK